MFRHLNLTICLCLGIMMSAIAQQPGVSGKITDQQQQPLPGATVLLKSSKDSSLVKALLSDQEGGFAFHGIAGGSYYLQVSFITYHPRIIPIVVPHNTAVLVQLQPATSKLKGVTVKGFKPTISTEPGKTVVNVEKSVVAQSQSVYELLKDLPGVTVSKDGEISIKGKKGAAVMIDGQLTNMSAAQLKNLLKATPGTTVKAIEILNNPPASMDASGNAGVINIRFSKKVQPGFNGTLTSGLGWGKYFKTDQGINLNYGREKWNFSASYAYAFDRSWWRDSIHRTVEKDVIEQVVHFPERITSHLVKIGIDHHLDSNNTISLQLGLDKNRAPLNGYAYTRFPDSLLTQTSNSLNGQRNLTATLQYKWKIDEASRFSAAVHTAQLKTTGSDEFRILTPRTAEQTRNNYPGDMQVYSIRADYARNLSYLGKKFGKMEAGFKSAVTKMNNTRLAEVLSNSWQKDPANSNRFRFSENIHAFYAQGEANYKQWDFRLGLRAENTSNRGDSLSGPDLVKQSYWSLFPNASVSYKVSDNYKLAVSYNRRIDRPDYQLLNPAIRYLDPFTIEAGSPTLRPQFSDNFELTQTLFQYLDVSVGYNRVKNAMVFAIVQEPGSLIAKYTTLNASLQHTYFGSLSFPLPMPKWWQNYNTVYFNSNRFAGSDYKESAVSWGFSTNNSITLPAKFSLEFNGWFDGGGLYGALRYKSLGEFSAGFSKQLLDDQLTVGFTVSDIFRSNRYRSTDASNNAAPFYLNGTWESRIAKVTLTWRFGRNQMAKQPEELPEEEDRLPEKKGARKR